MATNATADVGDRNGALKKRTQLKTMVVGEEHFISQSTGQFIDQKGGGDEKFKGVSKEKR
jgi:hypothetical protein